MAFLWHKEGVTAPICVKLFFFGENLCKTYPFRWEKIYPSVCKQDIPTISDLKKRM